MDFENLPIHRPEVGTRARRRGEFGADDFDILHHPLDQMAPLQRIVESSVRPDVMILQVHKAHAWIVPPASLSVHIRLDHVPLGRPIKFSGQRSRIPFKLVQHVFPPDENVLGHLIQFMAGVKFMADLRYAR